MNKVILIGNLTRDPDLKVTANNLSVCRFSIAVNRRYTSSDGSRGVDFINIVCFRNTADNCAKFLRKGSKVGVAGSLQISSYDSGDGVRRTNAEVVADEVQFLSSRSDTTVGDFDDTIEDLPEVKRAKTIDSLKPIEDDSVPF
ncbi:MAG: single-stranded DNA-binding protein [Christensenellales bacterium]|jgi:single-strand DNA-binding protein